MARPLGSKNKTVAELKVDAELAMLKAKQKELRDKKRKLEAERKKS